MRVNIMVMNEQSWLGGWPKSFSKAKLGTVLGLCLLFQGQVLVVAAPVGASVGFVTFAVGQVSRVPSGQAQGQAQPVATDQPLFVGDRLITGPNSHVHVRFIDGGLLSVRDSSVLSITQYFFDPVDPSSSKVRFDLQGGVARSITGKAGQAAKDQFRLNTPVAALGIRGTDFAAFASREESLFTVNSGVVVVAAFSGVCSRDALGPCAGPNSLELNLTGHHSARVGVGLEKPQPIPVVPDALRLAGYTNGNGHLSASDTGTGSNMNFPEGTRGGAQQVVEQAASGDVGGGVVSDRKGLQDIVASKVIDPSGGASLINDGSTALAWGYWQRASWAKAVHAPAELAMVGREVTVGSDQVGLFRDPMSLGELPTRGSVRLRLDSAQVHWQGNATGTPAIQSSSLVIDFASQSFATTLVGSRPDIGAFSVQATGAINVRGSQPGVFMSDPAQSNARVVGAMTQSGTQAGYFFEKPVAGGPSLSGTTLWRQ